MQVQVRTLVAALLMGAVLLLALAGPAAATFRKPPFNGSIFGKRGAGSSNEVDAAGQALSSLCAVATEACSSWFPGEN